MTDQNGMAKVSFSLPDNLTNFRVMVVSQSKNNFFGYADHFIEVRKDITVEPRIPKMLRNNDEVNLGANIFNATKSAVSLDVSLQAEGLEIQNPSQKMEIPAEKSLFVTWNARVTGTCKKSAQDSCIRNFTVKAIGKNSKHSDMYEGSYILATDPMIIQNVVQSANIIPGKTSDLSVKKTENTNAQASTYKLHLSNAPLSGIEKTYESLFTYPYGCVEQLLSSTLPNAILLRFVQLKESVKISEKDIKNHLASGYERIMKLQNEDGGFKYWENDFTSDIQITPHILRHLVELKNSGFTVSDEKLKKASKYL